MKILYHHRVASKDGQYVHIAEIISSLRSLGHEVIVCEPRSIQSTKFGSSSNTVERMREFLPGFVHEMAEMLYCVADYLRIRRLIRAHKPDCIYERYNLYFISGIWASKRFKLPVLMEVNSPLFKERRRNDGISLERLAQWTEDYVWGSADHVLPVTEVLAKIVEARGVARERITVIPNGINKTFATALPDVTKVNDRYGLEGKLVLGFTGFVRTWHRLDRVLRVIAEHPIENWHLFLAGDGPDRPRLEAMARELGVSDRLTVTGIVERENMPELVQRFDIALQPDVVAYASPLKMFEYMELAKPILAPDTENIREILVHERNALLFEPTDECFTQQLTRLCESPDLRKSLGLAAKAAVADQQLYWDSNAERIVTIFEELR